MKTRVTVLSVLPVALLIVLVLALSAESAQQSAQQPPTVRVRYSTTGGLMKPGALVATVDGKTYPAIPKSQKKCLQIVSQRGFEGKGATSALVMDITVSASFLQLRVIVTVMFVPWTVFIGAAVYQSWIRSSRSKVFFSYSTKDLDVAQRVIQTLGPYHFRTWTDFGKNLAEPARELAIAVAQTEAVIVLCSANSMGSDWVQYEIHRAKQKDNGGFRDFIIVTIDDTGRLLQGSLREADEQRKDESSGSLIPVIRARADELFGGSFSDRLAARFLVGSVNFAQRHGKRNRVLARLWSQEVMLFDLREGFDSVVRKLADHLKSATKLNAGGFLKVWRVAIVALWLVSALLLAFIWTI